MRTKDQVDAIMQRRGDVIDRANHKCSFTWCTGTIWTKAHWDAETIDISGRTTDVVDGLAVMIAIDYDETEDSRPQILLHIGSEIVDIDRDVSPTALQARRIALKLLQAADALDEWRGCRY